MYKQTIEVQDTVTLISTLLCNDTSSYASFAVLVNQAIARAVRPCLAAAFAQQLAICELQQASIHSTQPLGSAAVLHCFSRLRSLRAACPLSRAEVSVLCCQLCNRQLLQDVHAHLPALLQALAATVQDASNGYNATGPALDLTNAQTVQDIIYGARAWISTTSDSSLPQVCCCHAALGSRRSLLL